MEKKDNLYQKILVPLDGSDLSEEALRYGESLAQALGSDLILLHSCEIPSDAHHHMEQFYLEGLSRISRERMGQKIKVEPVILQGYPPDDIIDYASKNNISLIIMVTHSNRGIKRWVLGSTTSRVVRKTGTPVLLINPLSPATAFAKRSPCRIIVALDGSSTSEFILPYAEKLAMASKRGSEVTLFHVISPPRLDNKYILSGVTDSGIFGKEEAIGDGKVTSPLSSSRTSQAPPEMTSEDKSRLKALETGAYHYLEQASSKITGQGITVNSQVAIGNAAEEIIKEENAINADLIAMTTRGLSNSGMLFLGSVADRVLHTASVPLLLVTPPLTK
ncbi:MAG: universal stress protein [Chloroflexota bacterium]|nr:universal stress protein [Chloroflexota bacterium]